MKRLGVAILLLVVCLPVRLFAAGPGLHIHSFQTAGENAYDEFVSISNDTNSDMDVTGFTISRKSKTATSWNNLYRFETYTLAPGEVYTVANPKYTSIFDSLYSTSSYSLTADNAIAVRDAAGTALDIVGLGDSVSYEGQALPNPVPKKIYLRTKDTDNNFEDFISMVESVELDPNIDKVVISELLPDPSDGDEWFEIFNPTSMNVSLDGTKVCDALGSIHCYYFGPKDILSPYEYRVYLRSDTKITLNNTGDWLELRDGEDNLLTDSGGDYGSADDGISLSLFGSDYLWTQVLTPGEQNVFLDILEEEASVGKSAKSKKSTIKKTSSTKKPTVDTIDEIVDDDNQLPPNTVKEVKGVEVTKNSRDRVVGYSLIILAISIFVGYNLWENREYAKKLYNKISRRND